MTDFALVSPQNAALLLIDYQPTQVNSVRSRDAASLVANVGAVSQLAKLFELPVVLSTVNVRTGINKPMIPEIAGVFPGVQPIDRTTINAWEDAAFVAAVRATGRRKLVIGALWTEVCLAFPALCALSEGYEVYPIVDAVGGTSLEAHEAGLRRVEQAGAQPTTWKQLACELQRDWARTATARRFAEILFG
jgi:nicotinamidase-related amidase